MTTTVMSASSTGDPIGSPFVIIPLWIIAAASIAALISLADKGALKAACQDRWAASGVQVKFSGRACLVKVGEIWIPEANFSFRMPPSDGIQ